MTDDILVVADHRRGELRDVSFELITAARTAAEATGGAVHAAVISGPVEEFAESLNREGVDTVHTVATGEEFNHDVYTEAVTTLYERLEPRLLLLPNSVNGLDYAPAVATRCDLPLVTDAVDLSVGDTVEVSREMYGSKVETVLESGADQLLVTIRSGEWAPAENLGNAAIEPVDIDIDETTLGSRVTGYEEVAGGDVDISEADFLVSIGRGIEEEENLDLIQELVDVTGATLAASRPIVDNGWLPKNRQVGQSGKQVTPDVYLAIGISGAVQHVAGMKGADTIIAINTDPNAPIFDIADVGIVGDLFEVVPPLIEAFE